MGGPSSEGVAPYVNRVNLKKTFMKVKMLAEYEFAIDGLSGTEDSIKGGAMA